MEITRANFEEELGNITDNLKRSNFVGFDAEFTGILSGENFKHRLFDTTKERYDRIKSDVGLMLMTQVGLTMFQYDREYEKYIATGYTFHLCPQTFGNIDQSFLFQASTLDFLCRHNFDFNKFIYQGIPYLSKAEEARVRQQLREQSLFNNLTRSLTIEHERELQRHCSEVSKWLTSGEEDTMYLDVQTGMMRFIVHNELRLRFPDTLTTNSLGNSNKILIYRNRAVKGANEATSRTLEDNLLNDLRGFSKIISLLEEYKKPIVGHNIFLDTVLLHSQFIGPLPIRYKTFKENIHSVFPTLYDTKYLSHEMAKKLSFDEVWKSNALQDLYEFFSKNKCTRVQVGASCVDMATPFNAQQSFHEAGWDSYCSGYCFLRLGHWTACELSGKFRAIGPAQMLAAVAPLRNRVNVIRGAIPYMSVDGDDPPRNRPGLLHVRAVKERPINVGKLATLLSGYGSVDVKPYGPRAALVAANSRFTVEKIVKDFRNSNEYRVSMYNVYKHSTLARATIWYHDRGWTEYRVLAKTNESWSGAIITGSLMLYLLHKKVNS